MGDVWVTTTTGARVPGPKGQIRAVSDLGRHAWLLVAELDDLRVHRLLGRVQVPYL